MKNFKTLGYTLLTTAVAGMAAGCGSSLNSVTSNFANDNPTNHKVRLASIASQESKGFTVYKVEKDFVETKNYYQELRSRTTAGIRLSDSTFWLNTTDISVPVGSGFNRNATIYMGTYAQQAPEVQQLLVRAKQAADAADIKHSPYRRGLVVAAHDSNIVIVRENLSGGFTNKIAVLLDKKSVSHLAGPYQTSESTAEYNTNPLVKIAENYRNSKNFRISKNYRSYSNE